MSEKDDPNKELGTAIGSILSILDGLSSKDRTKALRAVCGANGLNANFPSAPNPRERHVPRAKEGKYPGKPSMKADPRIKAIRAEINNLNKEIATESKNLGVGLLSSDHDMIIRRDKLFRGLKEAQSEKASQAGPTDPQE